MENEIKLEKTGSWLERPLFTSLPKITLEHLVIFLIILAAFISRFYNVGLRVMAHDEVNHVVPSYELYQGRGYAHDPVTHGPLQFHLLAASYFLFGDNDFSSRIPSAIFSVATVIFVIFAFKRFLGRTGAILSGLFFLISPYMLFYGRYTRNEAFVALFGVIMIYAVLRYLENGKASNLYLFTTVLALHFCTKETSFIYTAELLIFLAVLFIRDVTRQVWPTRSKRNAFILVMMAALLFIGVALGASLLGGGEVATADESSTGFSSLPVYSRYTVLISLGLAFAGLFAAIVLLLRGLGWEKVKNIRSFDLLLLTGSLILPQLIAFAISIAGFDPLDYSDQGLIRTSIFLAVAILLSVTLGLVWKPRIWLKNAGIFYAIFTVLYTTFFTNGQGFFTGMVGSLGYWLSQQEVNRGSQPWFFFALLQVPMYEYLPLVGTIIAFFVGLKHKLFTTVTGIDPHKQTRMIDPIEQLPLPVSETNDENQTAVPEKLPVLSLLLFWSVLSLIAYTIAGEKMPWLTVHISLPMILSAGFGIGYLLDTTPFKRLFSSKGYLTLILLPVFLISLGSLLGILLGPDKPFSGKELAQLQTTSTFIFSVLVAVATGLGLYKLLTGWTSKEIIKIFSVVVMTVLGILTARSAFQASFINYDTAKEFLVYAHSARGPKDVLEQVEEISQRTTGGKDIKVVYIGDALYPYWWYFRDYPNKLWLKDELTREILNYPVIITDDEQYAKTQAIVKDGYFDAKYKRLVWPMQDYFNLTLQSFWEGVKNPQMRKAIFNIWLNKDYSLYALQTGSNSLTLENWQPSGNIHLLIRKDIVGEIWNYGTLPATIDTTVIDPYLDKYISLTPDTYLGSTGSLDGQFTTPHGITIGPDGSIYVADSRNHRIQKFNSNGQFLLSWGTYASIDAGDAPGGTFNEPWGIAVGPDGSVYVADTWNYRIQKFSATGKFITMWGTPGPGETPEMFWGPRGIAVDQAGLVYVTDTGNNRVVVFDSMGKFITQFGTNGISAGEFDEPVGLAVDKDGNVYVADTWNQRIQVFEPIAPNTYQYLKEWPVSGWFGQSVNNKPFLALDESGDIYVTDPDAFRVLQFDNQGNLIRGWGESSSGIDGFSSPSGVAVDDQGRLWVSDAGNNILLRFTLPITSTSSEPSVVEIPAVPEGLIYNQETGLVENELQVPVYRLSDDKKEWVPYIPIGIADLLEEGIAPQKDSEGNWILVTSDGIQIFKWDSDLLLWISTAPTPEQ